MSSCSFVECCSKSNMVKYDIIHSPKPIELLPALRSSIDRMLWYVPGISSVQSYTNYLIDDKIYSDAVFDMILDTMCISNSIDVDVIIDKRLPISYVSFYSNDICIECQKVIITRHQSETDLRAMLRHIRNAIAHGRFTIIDKLVLFIDKHNENTTAIIKIDIVSLDETIKQIEQYSGITQEKVLAKVFSKLGYKVKSRVHYLNHEIDILLEKDDKIYGIEIKIDSRNRLVGYQDQMIDNIISQIKSSWSHEIIPVFIYDKVRVSNKAKDRLRSEGIILLDRANVSELVNMSDVLS